MVEHFVKLERPPEGFEIPAGLSERLIYDETTKKLRYRGFMSKAEFDRLYLLSENWAYRRAVEELFRQATVESEVEEEGGGRGLFGRFSRMLHGMGRT